MDFTAKENHFSPSPTEKIHENLKITSIKQIIDVGTIALCLCS